MKDMISGNIYKTFFVFSIPMILSSVLSQAFGIINTSMAGIFLGSKGLAALGASSAVIDVMNSIFLGFSVGVGVYMADFFGAKDYKKYKNLVLSNLLLLVGTSVFCVGLAMLFNRPILHFLNIEDVIYADSRIYFFMMLINMPIALSNHYWVYASNAMGITTFPMVVSVISSVINVGGNILAITVLDAGVFGIGAATILASTIAFACYFIRFRQYFRQMGVEKEPFHFEWKYIRMSLPSSLPNSAQQFSMYLAGLLIAPIRNGLGYMAIAAVSIVTKLQSLLNMFYGSCARTVCNYIPQCMGAGQPQKIKKAIRVSFLQGFAFLLPLILLLWCIPYTVANLFVDPSEDRQVVEYVVDYIRVFLPFVCIHAVTTIFHSIFRGVKRNGHLFISTTICSAVGIIAAMILCPVMGIYGYYLQAIIGWAVECVYIFAVYMTGIWVPKELRPMILQKKEAQNI